MWDKSRRTTMVLNLYYFPALMMQYLASLKLLSNELEPTKSGFEGNGIATYLQLTF